MLLSIPEIVYLCIVGLACSTKYKLRTTVTRSGLGLTTVCTVGDAHFRLVDKRNKTTIREHAWKQALVNKLDSDSDKMLSWLSVGGQERCCLVRSIVFS